MTDQNRDILVTDHNAPYLQRLVTEGLGTAFLLAAIVGSSTLGGRLGTDTGIGLLANSLASAAVLYVLIVWFGPISGAHLNPVISLMMAGRRKLPAQECVGFIVAQLLGAFVGVALADVMFSLPVYEMSVINRNGSQILLSECVGTFGLIGIVWCCQNSPRLPAMIAVYVGAAFWFTPTGFVNPAVTIARAFTESPSGITLGDVPAFVGAEFVGAVMAVFLFPWLMGREKSAAN